MIAILSDIHGNLEALNAVLEDAGGHEVDAYYCLGDTTGYGPNPLECVDRTMSMQVVLLGNHDQAILFEPDGFCPPAAQSIYWQRHLFESASPGREQRLQFLAERPRLHKDGGFLFVHGSARNPLNEYVFPEDIANPRKLGRIFAVIERYCFQGHTHVPGVFTENVEDDCYHFRAPEDLDYFYKLNAHKTMINVGAVGQPRDGDWRACYVLLDGEDVHFRRVEYDINTTVQKIYDVPELTNFLGDRLYDGR